MRSASGFRSIHARFGQEIRHETPDCANPDPDGKKLRLYYGAADTVLCLATVGLEDLIALCLENPTGA